MIVRYSTYELPFIYSFTISKGTKTHQPTFVVKLEWRGQTGYGEAPAISYYDITTEKMAADLEQKKVAIERFALTDPERFWHFLHHLIPNNPFLISALDMAAWDLFGKMVNKPLYALWQLDKSRTPITDYTIGIDTPEKMLLKMQEKPWPAYKIKVGFDGDMELLTILRSKTDASIRVDANAGWTLDEALRKIPVMQKLGIELIEQPLAKDDWEGMKVLFEQSPIPLFADESCVKESDVEICAGYFHGINIKLTKCSGITPARRMIKQAKSVGLKTMLGCMNESTIGSSALLHLAPMVDYLDMDGPLLLKEDLATGLIYDFGKVGFLEHRAGLGVVQIII
ncbi:MAG: dipeptide epimerase [Chitinophagaceae bacterium]|nr:dipeptide epimerase [Chitinophagaceae bacterium]